MAGRHQTRFKSPAGRPKITVAAAAGHPRPMLEWNPKEHVAALPYGRRNGLRSAACAVDLSPLPTRGTAVSDELPQPLDEEALQRLRDLDPTGESRLVGRVLEAFESSVAKFRPQWHDAARRGDMLALRQIAHTLKSSSASIGALQLSRLCAEIENSIRQEAFAEVAPRLDCMDHELELVLRALKPHLGAPS